jgi:hypothetical protein
MAARLGVEPIVIASYHAVFALQPRVLAAVLAASADPREVSGFGRSSTARGALPNTRMEPTRARDHAQLVADVARLQAQDETKSVVDGCQ